MGRILAHGLGGRSDLPVPMWLAQYGAAVALVFSFAALRTFWRTPRLEHAGAGDGRPLPLPVQRLADAPATRAGLRALGLALAGITLAAAAFGPDDPVANPAPTWLYIWFWVGLVPASLLFGPVWRLMNPLRTLWAGLERLRGRPGGVPRPMPAGLGYWPAAASLAVFAWLELVYTDASLPSTVLTFLLAYGLVHLGASMVYGQAWFARGDGFEVYSTLLASLCPFGRRADGRLVVRNPLAGLAGIDVAPGLVAVVCVLLGGAAFDGLARTRWWASVTGDRGAHVDLLLGTVGLAAAFGFVAVTYLAATRASQRYRPARIADPAEDRLDRRFVHTLLPIAVGYTLAHYFSLLVLQGQNGYIRASDPFGRGWDLFGTASWVQNPLAVSTATIALVQVGAIVAGHMVGVVAAHDRAMATFRGRDRLRGQYLLFATMVCYTVGGIALLVGSR
jgi:hypothetical protein